MARLVPLLLRLLLAASVWAAPASAQDGPGARYLRVRHESAMTVIRRSAATEAAQQRRSEELRAIVDELLDYEELARRSLGTHWDSATPAQRTEFVSLLRQLVQRQYESNLERIVDFEIEYLGEEVVDGGRRVHTEARSRTERRQPPVQIDYSVRLDGERWRVFDVITDEVSLVQNYQRQFQRIIREHAFDGLLQRMRDRLAQPPH